MAGTRRALLLGAGGLALAGPARANEDLEISGRLRQGGFAFGRTRPGAEVRLDGEAVTVASPAGLFVVGFDRDAGAQTRLEVRAPGLEVARELRLTPGEFDVTRVSGLPQSTVTPSDPALLARIRREAALKQAAFASHAPGDGFRDGFDWPLTGFRVSSRWGAQRVLNGTPARPHYGIDLAAPAGTAITAPADGLVCLAEPDLHFEGGLTAIDHGQGLISLYLHQSRLDVRAGETVRRGRRIGAVGSSGRATGPHLCWRLKWSDRALDPSLMVGVSAPG
ncbi:MAG TPA: M23 family metallopeptidase [Caulobacteraceae bacterium]|jgi:murein DD-endopeptidase MepM/ murein hydrolase activator NlpD